MTCALHCLLELFNKIYQSFCSFFYVCSFFLLIFSIAKINNVTLIMRFDLAKFSTFVTVHPAWIPSAINSFIYIIGHSTQSKSNPNLRRLSVNDVIQSSLVVKPARPTMCCIFLVN